MKKWLAGIAASLITGVIVWLLTHPGGVINPVAPTVTPPIPTPRVLITNFEVDIVDITRETVTDARFTVYNEGEATAEECTLWWHSHGEEYAPSGTQRFSLTPKEKKDLKVQSFIYSQAGTYDSFAYVDCSNFRSEDVHRDVAVINLP